jgi:hypothetical protein
MTLDTRIYVTDKVDVHELFHHIQGLLTKHDDPAHRAPEDQCSEDAQDNTRRDGNPWTIGNVIDQGLPAWLMVHYRTDGMYRTPEAASEHDEYCNLPGNENFDADEPECNGTVGYSHRPACWAEVMLDTPYGYRGPNGEGCGDLHAQLVADIGRWCDERGLSWKWKNEFTDDIHEGYAPLAGLLSGGFEATSWFRTTVAPALGLSSPEDGAS